MKLSDFLKQQGDTPQGKSTYQAFIDNFDKDYDAESFRKDEKCSIAAAFQWDICPEDLEFWDIVDNKWQEVTDPENDMLWLLDGKEPPQEADVEDELEERRRKEAVTPTKQPPILPIGTNKLLDTEETKELDETVKAADPFGYFEEPAEQKEYPRWFKSTETEMIVQFDSLQSGKVIGGSVAFADGYYTTTWKPHTDTDTWQEVPNPELAQEQNKILDEANNIDGKNHLDTILAERGAKYGSYKAQAKCVGDIILATQEVAKANGKQQTAEQIGSIAYLAIKIARYANGEIGDTLDDLENYIKLTRKMEQDNV